MKPGIIAISETKLKNYFKNNIQLNGYACECYNSPTNAGGVGLFVDSQYTYSIVNIYNLDLNGCEELWIEINLSCNGKYIVGVIYRHPNSKLNKFQLCFERVLEKPNQNSATYYILGDINIDFLKVKTNTNIEHYQNTLLSLGCTLHTIHHCTNKN